MLFKPYGYLSQFVNNGPKKNSKKLLGSLYDFPEGVMSIGRLDEKSEGLLLITTDGKMSDFINTSGIEKEYYAQVDGLITDEALRQLQQGVQISVDGQNYKTKACKAHILHAIPEFPERTKKIRDARHGPVSWVSITLREGKFRQVRKMTSAVGFPTLRLVRVRVGSVEIGNLEAGEVRALSLEGIKNAQL